MHRRFSIPRDCFFILIQVRRVANLQEQSHHFPQAEVKKIVQVLTSRIHQLLYQLLFQVNFWKGCGFMLA